MGEGSPAGTCPARRLPLYIWPGTSPLPYPSTYQLVFAGRALTQRKGGPLIGAADHSCCFGWLSIAGLGLAALAKPFVLGIGGDNYPIENFGFLRAFPE